MWWIVTKNFINCVYFVILTYCVYFIMKHTSQMSWTCQYSQWDNSHFFRELKKKNSEWKFVIKKEGFISEGKIVQKFSLIFYLWMLIKPDFYFQGWLVQQKARTSRAADWRPWGRENTLEPHSSGPGAGVHQPDRWHPRLLRSHRLPRRLYVELSTGRKNTRRFPRSLPDPPIVASTN